MKNEWFDLRKQLLFTTSAPDFPRACERIRTTYTEAFQTASADRQQELIAILTELTIDMQSYLRRWCLQNPDNGEMVADEVLEQEAAKNYDLLRAWGADARVAEIQQAVADIKRSNFMKLSYMSDRGEMNTRWGNDFATGLTTALRKGAILVTTNPPLVNMARKNDPETWDAVREELKTAYPDASPEQLVSLLTMKVVLMNCRELRPIYEASQGKYGYVNLQISPENSTDAVKMAEEIEFIYEEMARELQGTPNVVFKVPGTKSSLETVKRVTKKGIGVSITVSFSVDQHLAFAEAIEEGSAPVSFLVMMNGRLDDPVCAELEQKGLADAAEVAKWGSTAIIRRSYQLLSEKGYTKSALLIASLRGPWNIEGSIVDGRMPLFITSFPDKTEQYDSVERTIQSEITEPVDAELLKKLRQSQLFTQAYEVDGLTIEGFDAFYPVVKTLTGFIDAYHEVRDYMAR